MSMESARERVVEELSAHYAEEHLTTQELEVRFERAYKAKTSTDLEAVLSGLPALRTPARAPVPRSSAAAGLPSGNVASVPANRGHGGYSDAEPDKRYLAIMSAVRKSGDWMPGRSNSVRAFMGEVKLDLREASFADAVVTFDVLAIMSDVKFFVPPGVRVECDGFAFMGEFTDQNDGSEIDPDGPVVRVTGTAFMSAVKVETRLPGEGKLQAWRRRRLNK